MEESQLLVQWEEYPRHLIARLGHLLERQLMVDVTLMCSTHTLKVHRTILAASSPYFERVLANHPVIVLKDMKFSVLKSLVEFMYCGETSVNEENLSPLLEAAKFFEVKGLAAMTKESVALSSGDHLKTTSPPSPSIGGYVGGRGGRGRGRGRPRLRNRLGSPMELGAVRSEPRRRGRRRGAINCALREKLLREAALERNRQHNFHIQEESVIEGRKGGAEVYLVEGDKGEDVIESLKQGAASEAQLDPEAVVLYQVTDDKKVEKCVLSAGEVSALKLLNEQLKEEKREVGEMGREEVGLIGDTQVAEVKLKMGKSKSILSQVMECIQQSMRNRGEEEEAAKTEKMRLEFIDDSGKSIKGYEVEGRLLSNKEEEGAEEGLYSLFCPQGEKPQDYNILYEEGNLLFQHHDESLQHPYQFDIDMKFKKENIALAQPILSPRQTTNL